MTRWQILGFEHIISPCIRCPVRKEDIAALVRFAAEHPLRITFPAELVDTPGYVERAPEYPGSLQ